MIKAAIYDLDDLMIDSLEIHLKATKETLKELGYDFDRISISEKQRKRFVGMRVKDIIREYKKYFKIPDKKATVDQIFQRREEIFLKMMEKKESILSMKGLFESIKFLKQLGLKLALVSSGTKAYIQLVLHHLNLKKTFELVVSGEDVKQGKPNPECYLLAKRKLNINDFEGFVLEDAQSGIEAALGAKLIAIGVPSPRKSYPQDLSKAHLVISDLSEVNQQFLARCNQLSEKLIG